MAQSVRQFLHKLFTLARDRSASAVVLQSGASPALRIHGADVAVSPQTLDMVHMQPLCEALLGPAGMALLAAGQRAEASVLWDDLGRFNAVARRYADGCSIEVEPLPLLLPDFEWLMLPADVCGTAAEAPRGLVLVAGDNAAVRAAVLAAFARARALLQGGAVLVVDARPAYSFEHAASAISMAASLDAASAWAAAHARSGCAAVRTGDLHDGAAWQRAMYLAGRVLCLASAPLADLMAVFGRIDDLPAEGASAGLLADVAGALQLAIGIHGIRPGADGRAVCASEVLVCTPAAREWLRDVRFGELLDLMRASASQGMRTRDQHLLQLYEAQHISALDAMHHAERADRMESEIRRVRDSTRFTAVHAGTGNFSIEPWPAQTLSASPPQQQPAVPIPAALAGAAPRRPSDNLQFRAYTPPHFERASVGLVDIWACLATQAADVAALAASTAQTVQAGLRTGVPLERGVAITVRLRAEGLRVRSPPQTMLWMGEPCNVSFEVASSGELGPGLYPARAQVSTAGVPVCSLSFLLMVRPGPPNGVRTEAAAEVRHVRSAFASYATPDRPEVLARIQGMKKIAPALDVFVDALSLRSGQRWQQRVEEEVQRRERLFLFWSREALKSEWVDFEWRLAHRLKGLDAIDPVPLDDPSTAPPPRELSALHFGDEYLLYIRRGN